MSISTAAFGGKHTPKQVLLDALEKTEDCQCLVVVYLDSNDYVMTSWSDGSMLQRMGMMDVAKLRMFDAAQDEE